MPPGVLRISIAILMALPLSGVLVTFLVLVAEIPILSALLILGVLDISVVFGGYYLIRRSLSK